MVKLVSLLISFLIYPAMFIQFQYPNYLYINYIDNFVVFYKVIGTVGVCILSLAALMFLFFNNCDEKILQVAFGSNNDQESFKKAIIDLKNTLSSLRHKIITVFSILGFFFAFIGLGDVYLGSLFGVSMFFSYINRTQSEFLIERLSK